MNSKGTLVWDLALGRFRRLSCRRKPGVSSKETVSGCRVRGAGSKARARASNNQEQVGKGSSHQDRLRQIFQDVAWEHRTCQGLSAGLWGADPPA